MSVQYGRVGGALRALRRHRGLRQADVGRLVGVSQSFVSRAERGRFGNMPLDVLTSLFHALDARLELRPQ